MKTPLISVIIIAYNSEKIIEGCINSVISQDFPREKYEIIIVDDGSIDKTAQFAKSAGADKVISTKNQGFWKARMIGVEHADGKFLGFIDSDCELMNGWLKTVSKELETNSAIGGPLLNGKNHSLVAWAEYFTNFSDFHEHRKRSRIEFLPGGNQVYRKEMYPMSEKSPDKNGTSEDVIRSHMLKEKGIPLLFVPELQVKHYGRTKLGDYLENMKKTGSRVYNNSKVIPTRYTKLSTNKWNILHIFFLRIGARARRAIQAKKFLLFLVTLPIIILGTASFCKGFIKEMDSRNKTH